MARPSLFAHAPSELSQDAFLAWLAEWADPAFMAVNAPMHRAGQRFVLSLFEAARRPLPVLESVRVELQQGRIDLLVIVNGRTAVVIEDKVHSDEHGNQLERYADLAGTRYEPENVVCVYLKTGDQDDLTGVENAAFAYYSRTRLLRTLREGIPDGVDDDIYVDFVTHLETMDAAVGAWRTLPVRDWAWNSVLWKGLLDAVQDRLGGGNWGWVNNRAGGFYGLWWAWRDVDGGTLYVQADSVVSPPLGRLGIRFRAGDAERRGFLANRWSGVVLDRATEGGLALRRPRRIRASGETTMIAAYQDSWLRIRADGTIDLDASVALLRACEQVLLQAGQARPS